jgi:hypothetical protein
MAGACDWLCAAAAAGVGVCARSIRSSSSVCALRLFVYT